MADARRPAQTCGAYVAWHPWLAPIAVHCGAPLIVKVGHSGRLGDRLSDSAYATCWSEGWRYLATFEVGSKEEAQRIEESCLQFLRDFRIDGRELTTLPTANSEFYEKLLVSMAEHNRIPGTLVRGPSYLRTPPDDPPEEGPNKSVTPPPVVPLPVATPPPVVPPPVAVAAPSLAEDDLEQLEISEFRMGVDTGSAVADMPLEERAYQTEAAAACLTELRRLGRTTLVMACRCGKTRVAHMVISDILAPSHPPVAPPQFPVAPPQLPVAAPGMVLFLVPWLALTRQTVGKLCSYGFAPAHVLMIGSGEGMTTDVEDAGRRMVLAAQAGEPLLVVSTYHSSHVACSAAEAARRNYSLTVFDECHHVCGSILPRPANHVLLRTDPQLTGPRLFMTATPDNRGGTLNMSDHSRFGGVAYRYHLRQGIAAGYVGDFEIQLVASSKDAFKRLDALSTAPAQPEGLSWRGFLRNLYRLFRDDANTTAEKFSKPLECFCQDKVLAAQVAMAFEHLVAEAPVVGSTKTTRNKLLVFCRTIAGAKALCEEVNNLFKLIGDARQRPVEVALLVASSRTPRAELAASLKTFYQEDTPAILFNCKLFQEGIEFPPLNGVFFATPRHSSRDIIQSMCRALTRKAGKPPSVIFIPVPPSPPDSSGTFTKSGISLGRFETLLPFAEAIYSEDPRFYEHLLDPAQPYPIGWLGGAYGTGEELLHAARRAIRYGATDRAAGKRVIDRLTRNERIPWDVAFSELRRTVELCKRYPKGNDGFAFSMARVLTAGSENDTVSTLNFGTWFDWARREYGKFVGGEASALQPHQARDLESLESWKLRGMGGPYPTVECVQTLARVLEENGGKMPPININNGGWIGLDATPLERLSGFLTTISQQDGRARAGASGGNRGFNVAAEKARLLDQAFSKWGLVWRKERWFPDEELDAVVAAGQAADREAAARFLTDNRKPGFLLTHTTKSGKAGDYIGPKTAIQLAHEQFMTLSRADPKGAYIQKHWPGYPEKHKHMEHLDVWEKGLAPPRHAKGKLITRAPKVTRLPPPPAGPVVEC